MYTRYVYPINTTAAAILADMILLLTGTTDKLLLSTGTVKTCGTATVAAADIANAATEIYTTSTVAGWELFDNGGAITTAQCVRSRIHADNGGTGVLAANDKFMVVDVSTAGYIRLRTAESITNARIYTNETAQATGLGQVYAAQQKINITVGGFILISASARHCALYNFNSTDGWTTGLLSTTTSGPTGVFERTRRNLWDTNANAYPVSLFMCTYTSYFAVPHWGNSFFPRILNVVGADFTPTGDGSFYSTAVIQTVAGGSYAHAITAVPFGANKELRHPLTPIYVGHANYGFLGGDISTFSDIWMTTPGIGVAQDEITYNGNTYVLWTAAVTTAGTVTGRRYAIRKG